MTKRGAFLRKEVLRVMHAHGGPRSAYDILDALRRDDPKMAPTTVYRALAALLVQGQIHRLESLNAYMPCQSAGHADAAILSICDDCGTVAENVAPEVMENLSALLGQTGFSAQRHVIEVHGTCGACEPADPSGARP